MAVLSLPLQFKNSFWSQDYRRGLEVLYTKLEQGVAENGEILSFIRSRAVAEGHLANSLTNPGLTGRAGTGFGADDGASLLMAFRGLQAESVAQGQIHKTISRELSTLVADPFDEWAQGYKERLRHRKTLVMDEWLRAYEQALADVGKLRNQYLTKVRRADEAEDDAKFAPSSADKYTSSPVVRPVDGRAPPQRTASVSERIAQRLKEIQKRSANALAAATSTEDPNASPKTPSEKELPVIDKGKGRVIDVEELASPPPMSPALPAKLEVQQSTSPDTHTSPAPILLAGLALQPAAVSQLLTRAAAELPLRPVRFPLLGEYQDAFTGEEFVAWLVNNVPGFGNDMERAEVAAKDLTETEGLLRRLGELGNEFEQSDDAFYQFRSKAFDLEGTNTDRSAGTKQETLIKRTGNLVSLVSKALNSNNSGEPAFLRARHDAEESDKLYRVAIRKLDRQRLALEDMIEDTLKVLQRWEVERLRAVKTVLLQYQGTLANIPKALETSLDRSATLISAYQPESDLTALIERYRTGPFRPDAHVYESLSHDESDVVFGIDLRKWAEGGWYALTSGQEKKEPIPPVLTALLNGITEAYSRLPNDNEKRKAWIYDVPLPAIHHLREILNGVPLDQPFSPELFTKYDAPVIASTIKLWALELDPPLALYEGWDEFRKLYPTVGAAKVTPEGAEGAENSEEQRLQNISAALLKLPRVHLYVLDELAKHLKTLIATTKVEETDEVYITKLAFSLGRAIIRPKHETEISIQDRHPSLLFIDLIKNYDELLPPTITRKKRESERKIPTRKRTALVDMRLSRSRISVGADAQQLLAAQQVAQNPSLMKSVKSPPGSPAPGPSLPPPPPPPLVASPKSMEPPALPVADIPKVPPPPPPSAPKANLAKTPPPPPPITSPLAAQPTSPPFTPPPPPPTIQKQEGGAPPRPVFKEPPPENDDLPPRPSFKEPPPESDEETTSAPTPTSPELAPVAKAVPAPPATITPAPQKRFSATGPSTTKVASRSPTPPDSGDTVLSGAKTTLSRNSSGQTAPLRGPRLARPAPRGAVQSMVSNLNRNSVTGSPPPTSATSNTRVNRLSGSPVRRPSSVLGRSAAFSLRTMASDAEDELVDKK